MLKAKQEQREYRGEDLRKKLYTSSLLGESKEQLSAAPDRRELYSDDFRADANANTA